MKFFNGIIVPILSSVNEGIFSSILFILLCLIYSISWYKRFKRSYYVFPLYSLCGVLLSSIYWYYRFFTSDYTIITSDLIKVGFSDVIFGWIFCFGIISIFINMTEVKPCNISPKDNRSNQNKEQNEVTLSLLEEDNPITNSEEDELGFEIDVDNLFKQINNRDKNSSFSIGINARWGDGKSSFINLLVEKFRKNEERFVVVQFNPRHTNNNSIQSSFFEMLFSELSKYDSRFKHSFNDYLRVIDVITDNKYLSAIFNTAKLFNRFDEKEKINNAIKRLKKRIIVIIEDLDRLMVDEIIEVFKLIDGNASFNNIIFICAYDKNRIQYLIKSEEDYNIYSDKFFTWEQTLPLRSWDLLLKNLTKNLTKGLDFNNDEEEEVKNIISFNYSIFKSYLHNLRDVKRYINLVKPSLKKIYKEVQIKDYLLLGLIRYKYPQEYKSLYEKNAYKDSNLNLKRQITIDEIDNYKSKDILKVLFPEYSVTFYRSINSVGAFSIYFHEHLFEHLSIECLRAMFEKDTDYKIAIKEILDNKKWNELTEYLDSLRFQSLQSWDEVVRYMDIFIYLNAHYNENYLSTISVGLFFEKRIADDLCKRYSLTQSNYKALLSQRLMGKYPEYPFEISKQQLWAYKSGEIRTELIFSETELMDILKNSLKDLIRHEPTYSIMHRNILRCCISHIDPVSRKVTLDPEACELIRQTIERKPDNYINDFVFLGVTSSSPDWNNITCEAFWEQIFGDKDKMKKFISDDKLNGIINIDRVRHFWQIYENNGYETIEFQNQGSVKSKIDNNLVSEVEKLNAILSIESQINSLIISDETLESSLKTIKDLFDKLNANTLYIKKRGDVLKLIKNKFNELTSLVTLQNDSAKIQSYVKYINEHLVI